MKLENPRNQEKSGPYSVGLFTVQCAKCFKWRIIPTQEEYENIRHKFIEDPWVCTKKFNVSCEDPADIEYDNTRTWLVDRPNIPKTPAGFKRGLTVRKCFSKSDSYYIVPTGKKVRAPADVEKFLEENPKYRDVVEVSDFNFATPKIMEDTIPRNLKAAGSSKKIKMLVTDD